LRLRRGRGGGRGCCGLRGAVSWMMRWGVYS